MDEIAEWFEIDPEANLGVITGEPSGIVVADFDRRAAGFIILPRRPSGRAVAITSTSEAAGPSGARSIAGASYEAAEATLCRTAKPS